MSPDAAEFALVEGAPELASDAVGRDLRRSTRRRCRTAGWPWAALLPAGRIDRDPAVWTSPDGRSWRRAVLPGGPEYEELQRVALVGGVPVAVGLRGSTFGAWRQDGGRLAWPRAASGDAGRRGVPAVGSLVAAGDRLVAAVTDGVRHSVWVSADRGGSWREVAMPLDRAVGRRSGRCAGGGG